MEEYDCSFLINKTEYNLREKFLYDLSGKINSYWIYKSEGPVIFSRIDLSGDDKYVKSIGADKTPKIVDNKIAYGADTLRIEMINDEYKLIFMELDRKVDRVRLRTIYKYK